MEEVFHESPVLEKAELHALMAKSNNPALVKFILMVSAYFISAALSIVCWSGTWWQVCLTQLLFGITTCSVFACLHETAHNTAFSSRQLNKIAAGFCGIASLYPAAIFRDFHFQHHRYTHIPGKDPEISLGNKPIPGVLSSLPMYFAWLSGLPFIVFKSFMVLGGCLCMPEFLRTAFFPFVRKDSKNSIAIDSWLTAIVYILTFFFAMQVNNGFYAIFTGMVVGQLILSAYLLPEHNGLPHEGIIFDKTRSMLTGKTIRSIMWNMPYHAEHHAYPAVPFHALPALHEKLRNEIHHQEAYPSFHKKVLRRDIV